MALEVTYAEVKFENESKSSGTNSGSPAAPKEKTTPHESNHSFPKLLCTSLLIFLLLLAISFFTAFIIFFQKYYQLLEEKKTIKELVHTELECKKENLTTEEKVWSCCPKNWKPFSSNCYFISTESRSWNESEQSCSAMEAHLLVINSKEKQDFITSQLQKKYAYYLGLSDPQGNSQWQWVDQTPYNKNVTFWHSGEPSNGDEHCVMINARSQRWGWNDVRCDGKQMSICEMMKIYL
ncbi:PREDICTED: C-type lectin domain family 4 member A isoform X1 [Galeopterus variegatus]|uniref:C-type lectin domain family 4 member A isoform X1 n=1 Tax=Galeopterus variegatus TaxID=482537 RepID=A0ABM0SF09_GALVR|nr:PREDICTED: C-type lectin domain family 4 member A isoform X1 [Galeopterus variegatus]